MMPSSAFFRVFPNEHLPLDVPATGLGSLSSIPATTLPRMLKLAKERHPDRSALAVERPVPAPEIRQGVWKAWSHREYYDEARSVAKGLWALGVQPHNGVTLQGSNQPEMFIGYMAVMMIRATPGGIYATDTIESVSYKAWQLGAQVTIVESIEDAQRLTKVLDRMPRLHTVVVFLSERDISNMQLTRASNGSKVQLLSWKELQKKGLQVSDGTLDALIDTARPEECAMIVFTSGTTGVPKAVMLSHDALCFEPHIVLSLVPEFGISGQESVMSYLPLSHVAAIVCDFCAPLAISASRKGYGTAFCARAYDIKRGTLVDRLRHVRPTLFIGVPRVYEKMQEKLQAVMEQAPVFQRFMMHVATVCCFALGTR